MTLAARDVAAAIRAACRAELHALKPGNVHVHAEGHGMTVAQFEASAKAIAPVLAEPGLRVGERILKSVEATRAAVGCNTNLGIVLLAAPLAEAALLDSGGGLRSRLARVLAGLTVEDAERTFRAIRLAGPAGLGESDRHDVSKPATAGLREVMAEAAGRDRIARQYATDFEDVFDLGLPRLRAARARWDDESWAATGVYLDFLARFPDSHVARKFGAEAAEAVRRRAGPLADRLGAADRPEAMAAALLDFDRALKAEGLNPGTSADLTVACLLADRLERLLPP